MFWSKNMKCIRICIISAFIFFIFSCHPQDTVFYRYYYYKVFFLGEDNVFISGTVYKEYSFITPANYEKIYARTNQKGVEGWQVIGTKNDNIFQIVLKESSNGVVLSKDTIDENQYLFGLLRGRIAFIDFYINDYIYPYGLRGPYYKEQRTGLAGQYDYKYYRYIYVAEPIDLSRTETKEGHNVFGYDEITTYYYDYNFDKPGWYKLCSYDRPVGNDVKHYYGNNTYLFTD